MFTVMKQTSGGHGSSLGMLSLDRIGCYLVLELYFQGVIKSITGETGIVCRIEDESPKTCSNMSIESKILSTKRRNEHELAS